jgi:HK97 gp10 family phage protein
MPARVRGVAATRAALERVQLQIEAASPTAVGEAGKVVASAMSSRAPRRTGYLASQISVASSSAGEGATARVGSDAPYDRYVQRGTVNMGAQPYGEDAAAASASGVVAAMIAVYRAALE